MGKDVKRKGIKQRGPVAAGHGLAVLYGALVVKHELF